MKTLFFSLAALLILLITGCQENPVTGPVPDESANKISQIPEITTGTIPLEGVLKVPGTLNTYLTVKGKIAFTEKLDLGKTKSLPFRDYISLELSANGTFGKFALPNRSLYRNLWYISSDTDDQIFITNDGQYKIVKVYPIKGRNDNLALICEFTLTTHSVRLADKRLGYTVNKTQSSLLTF